MAFKLAKPSKQQIRASLVASPVVLLALAYVVTWFIQTDVGVKGGTVPLGFALTIWVFMAALAVGVVVGFIVGVCSLVLNVYTRAINRFEN